MTISDPSSPFSPFRPKRKVAVNFDLTQAHSFALISKDPADRTQHVKWHTGDIYAYSTQEGAFPSNAWGWVEEVEEGDYWVLVKVLYEIRKLCFIWRRSSGSSTNAVLFPGMFGDPKDSAPTIRFRFGASPILNSNEPLQVLDQAVLSESAETPMVEPIALGVQDGMIGLGHVVDGWIWGKVGGIACRAGSQHTVVKRIELASPIEVSSSCRGPLDESVVC